MIKPSKKILSMFVITAALVAAIMLAFGREKSGEAINFASNLVAGEKVSIPQNENWQNELRTTNTKAMAPEATSTDENLTTATDDIAVNLMSNYLTLKQSGNLNQQTAQQLIDQAISYTDAISSSKPTLVAKLNIVKSDKQTVVEYGERLGGIFKNNTPVNIKNEIDIVTEAIQSNDTAKMADVDEIINIYQEIGGDLANMAVPTTFVKAHLDMINGINSIATSLKDMKTVFNDPLRSLSALKAYGEGATMLTEARQATIDFIKQSGVVYEQGSGGYYLLYGI